jgi:hypothetical protein
VRCSSCKGDTPGKTLKGNGYRCPICGHRFVAFKKTDGLSDLNIAQAIAIVSESGTLYYLQDHLAYHLHRRLAHVRRSVQITFLALAAVLAVVAVVFFVGGSPGFGLLALILAILSGIWAMHSPGHDTFSLAERFELANPPMHRVPDTRKLIKREQERGQMLGALRSAGRVLLCQHGRDAEFLIANDFHLKNVCPVTGPDGIALDGFPELATRLAKPGALDLFLLHDFTPRGAEFARNVGTVFPALSQRRDQTTLIDMGFDEPHRPLLENALLSLDRIRWSLAAQPGVPWPGSLGARVTAMRPALLLAAAGRSIEERAPMRVPGKDDDDSGYSSDSDKDDSE